MAESAPAQSYSLAELLQMHYEDIAKVRVARMRGLRGLVLKNHFEPTATLAYLLRKEVPDIELFGGLVMNLTNGGINP
jgi:hypothetical protein